MIIESYLDKRHKNIKKWRGKNASTEVPGF